MMSLVSPAAVCRVLPLVLGLVAVAPHSATAFDHTWPWQPHRVAATLVTTDDRRVSAAFRGQLIETVFARLRPATGEFWKTSTHPLQAAAAFHLARRIGDLNAEQASKLAQPGIDKHFLIAIAPLEGVWSVRVREWDANFNSLGSLLERRIGDRALLADAVVQAVLDAFRAPARIVDFGQNRAELSIQGSMLLPPDKLQRLVRRGDGFQPYFRLRARSGAVVDAQSVPWTLIRAGEFTVDAEHPPSLEGEIITGLRNPLAGGRRGRNELWALAVGRPSGGTWLSFRGGRSDLPLADCEVYRLLPERRYESLGKTDYSGKLFVPAHDGQAESLIVTSRYLPLAKLPLVPGLVAEVAAPVAADHNLRAVEDWLAAWQSDFVELYIRRRALIVTAGYLLDHGRTADAKKMIDQIHRLGARQARVDALDLRRRSALGASASESRLVEAVFALALRSVAGLDDTQAVITLAEKIDAALKKS